MALAPGTRLGAYEILALIGAGGMGEVYKARDTRLNRTVAIKILAGEVDTDPQFRERFDREARVISQLTHPRAPLFTLLLLFTFSLYLCPTALAGQSTRFRAATDLVVVPVTVTDRDGRFVRGLTAEQFEISDEGTPRAVVQFSAERVPVSLGILLDVSGSMTKDPQLRAADDARWADTRRALELLLTRLAADDEVMFSAFSDKVAVAPWTRDRAAILRGFDLLQPGGGTALLDAVKLVSPAFQRARHQRKVLLLISDGNDTSLPAAGVVFPYEGPATQVGRFETSQQTQRQKILDSTRVDARRSAIAVYAIGIGTRQGVPVDTVVLETLTTDSGGYVEPLRAPSEIPAAVARICNDIQSQYLLAFEPGRADGDYHAIRVRTKDTRLRVRARAGYVSAFPPK